LGIFNEDVVKPLAFFWKTINGCNYDSGIVKDFGLDDLNLLPGIAVLWQPLQNFSQVRKNLHYVSKLVINLQK